MSGGVCIILNRAAGKGRGARAEGAVRRAFAEVGVTDVRPTRGPGDERTLAAQAIADGVRTIVAIGGDGTWGNVANAIIGSGAGADVRLALAAAGTGNDFAKTLGVPATDYAATARLAVSGPDAAVDVGCIEDKYFLNVAGFGFDIAVLEDVATITRLSGSMVYIYSALRQLFRYGGIPIDVASPAARRGVEDHLMLILANGRNFGGAFRIAPTASLTDGHLDAIAIRTAPPLRRLRLFSAAARGTHQGLPEVRSERAASFTLTFASPPAYETDGEYNRAVSSTIEVRCVPRALRVVVSPAATAAALVPAAAPA